MQTQSPARARDVASAIGGEQLAEGLMLVRASTLKIVRLQLAMERDDRRVALEEVDDLLALDRRLQDYLVDVPAAEAQAPWRRELDSERAALDREKWTLAAEVIRRESPVTETQRNTPVDAPDADVWGSFEFAADDQERRKRGIRRVALVLVLLSVLTAAAELLAGPDALASIAAWTGAVR